MWVGKGCGCRLGGWVKGSVKYVLAVGECGWVKYVGAVKVGEVGG